MKNGLSVLLKFVSEDLCVFHIFFSGIFHETHKCEVLVTFCEIFLLHLQVVK